MMAGDHKVRSPATAQLASTVVFLNEVRAGHDVIIATPGHRSLDAGDLLYRYLKHLAEEADVLPWNFVNPEFAHSNQEYYLGLGDIYTELYTTEIRQITNEQDLREFMRNAHKVERVSIHTAASAHQKLLVLGDPGSGKSSFLKYLALSLANAQSSALPSSDPRQALSSIYGRVLPIYVELRRISSFADSFGETEDSYGLLMRYLRHKLDEWATDGMFEFLTERIRDVEHPVLFMLDGLDEVPTRNRQLMVNLVNSLARRFDRHRYIVTCRPYAYVGQPWQLRDFDIVTLAPFVRSQVERFVENWYRNLMVWGISQADAVLRSDELKSALQQNDLSQLAESPLLLTVMAQLHASSPTGRLPDERTELYAEAVQLLLQRWEGHSGETETLLHRLDIPGLKASNLEAALYDIGFKAHELFTREATVDIDEAVLRKWLAPHLDGLWDKAGIFVEYIRERAGLLVRHKTEAYSFPHSTFREYLAACHLANVPDYPLRARELVHRDFAGWREVFLLAAGYAARNQRASVAIAAVNELCPTPLDTEKPKYGGPDWRGMVLAGAALIEIGTVWVKSSRTHPALLERLRIWLKHALCEDSSLSPQERIEAGIVLARLGDPRDEVRSIDSLEVCYIPAGDFHMGTVDQIAFLNERPRHSRQTSHYWISRFPISNAQFEHFIDDGGYSNPDFWFEARTAGYWESGCVRRYLPAYNGLGEQEGIRYDSVDRPYRFGSSSDLSNHPVVGVSWYEAVAFARWLNRWLHRKAILSADWVARLPSESEWEKASKGAQSVPVSPIVAPLSWISGWNYRSLTGQTTSSPDSRYPWGDQIDANRINYSGTGIGAVGPLGCFPGGASPYGNEEMCGTIWEWTSTIYSAYTDYYRHGQLIAPQDASGETNAHNHYIVVRGGTFHDDMLSVRSTTRFRATVLDWNSDLGFRLVLCPAIAQQEGDATYLDPPAVSEANP